MSEPLVAVRNLRTLFPVGANSVFRTPATFVHAVDDVSIDIDEGEALALVGESGCGKSTLALTLLGLERPTSGSIDFAGQDMTILKGSQLKAARRNMQMIFQDPYESLNPLMRVGEIVAEPLVVHQLAQDRSHREQLVRAALEDAGLKPAEVYFDRYPYQLSGGQRQRVAIAAALVLEPRLLLADEPVSMLDVSIRAEILNLLAELKQTRKISILFITHDLGTVTAVADRIAVMYLGRIVELGPTAVVLANPRHPYTKALLSVVPAPNPRLRKERIILKGETPDPTKLPAGCRFAPRCPVAQPQCLETDPPPIALEPGHTAACHFA